LDSPPRSSAAALLQLPTYRTSSCGGCSSQPRPNAPPKRKAVYIYDGLTDRDVQRALDEEFGRVDSMMFIRTRKTDDDGEIKRDENTGEVEVEDDGC